MIALVNPAESWVAKWQRLSRGVPGIYAIKIAGVLEEADIEMLSERGISYVTATNAP